MNKKYYAAISVMVLMLATACTQEPASIVRHPTSSAAKAGVVYNNPYKTLVEKGDTLYSIARKNNVEVRAVIDANSMRPPYTLIPGQTIKLPQARFHIVSDSDNLYAISRSYDVDISRLAKRNNLTPPYNLTKGQKLFLPSVAEKESDVASKDSIKYDFGTNESYGASRGVASSELAPIGSKEEKIKPEVIAKGDDSSPFATTVKEEKVAPAKVSENENLDKKDAEPFTYKSEGEFGESYDKKKSEEKKVAPVAPVAAAKKADTHSVSSAPAVISSSPIPAITSGSVETPTEKTAEVKEAPKQKTSSGTKPSGNVSFIWPASGKVISGFGPKSGGLYNDGINIAARAGVPIKAAADGEVVYSGSELKGYGNMLLLRHNNGYLTAYAHAQDITAKKGDVVKAGQVIGHIGETGHVSSPQLHFSIRQGRKAIDPEKFLH